MACSILRDKETGKVVQVLAPNGEPSLLYKNALEAFSQDQEKALMAWAKPYTSSYKLRYGDWEKGESVVALDPNGEPTIDTVLHTPGSIINMITTKYANWEEFQPGEDGWVSYEKAVKFKSVLSKKMPGVNIDIMLNPSMQGLAKLIYGTSIKDTTVKFSKSEINQQKEKVNSVMDYLVQKLPGLTYEWVSPTSLKQDEHYWTTKSIRAYVRNNRIYLVEGRVTPEDGIEEVMHVFLEALRINRPSLFKGLLDNAKSNPKYEAEYILIRDWYNSNFKKDQGLTDTINSEFLAKQLAVAMKAELEQNPEGKPTSAFGKLIQRFLDWLGELFNAKTLKPGEALSVLASYINTKDIVLPLPESEYLYYSADPDANIDPDDRDMIDAMMKENRGKTIRDLNIKKAKKEIEKLEKLKSFIIKDSAVRKSKFEKQLQVIDILINNVKNKITALEEGRDTTSVTVYKGSNDIENSDSMATKVGAGFGNFYHYLIEDIQDSYMETGESPSIIFSDPEWFDNFYKKHSDLVLFKNIDKKVLRNIGLRLVSKMDNLLSENKILLPEISIGVEDIDGVMILGRLDVMTVDSNGLVDIVDLKTTKSRVPIKDNEFSQVVYTSPGMRINGFKEGVDPAFDQFRVKSKLNDYQLQLSIYSEMLRKIGINVNNNIIYAVSYTTTSNDQDTEFDLTGYSVGTFQIADFYRFDGKGSATNKTSMADAIDQAARSRFRESGQILEEDGTATESKKNAFASLSVEDQERIIQKLDQLTQEQIETIDREIKKIDANDNLTVDEKSKKINSLRKRIAGILSIQEKIRKEKTGETEEAIKLSHAVIIKGAIEIFKSEIETLRKRVDELNAPSTYEIGNEQHQKALKEIQQYTTNLDNIGKYFDLFKNSVLAMNLEKDVQDNIISYLSNIQDEIATVTAVYIKISKGVVKSIIKKTIGEKRWEDVFGDMRKVLGPKLDWIKRTIAAIESGQIQAENTTYKLTRFLKSIFNRHDNVDRLQALKLEAARIEKLLQANVLNDTTLDDYLEGILNDPDAPFYMGSTMSGTQSILPMSDIIGSNVDSELIVNAMFQYMRNVTEEGRIDTLSWADDLNVDKFKNDFIQSAGGIANANNMITEEVQEDELFDENGKATQSETIRRYVSPFGVEFENEDAAYRSRLRTLGENISEINKAINNTVIPEEKEKLRAEKKQYTEQRNQIAKEYVEWQIDKTNTQIKPEIMRLMMGSGSYNQEITDLYLQINNITLEAGGDENLTPEDQENIDRLEAEISRVKMEMIQDNPESAAQTQELLENFQFDLNYKLWIKKRSEIEKEGNAQQLKVWDQNNSDYVPTEEWTQTVADLNEQKRNLFGEDAILKDLYGQQSKLRSKAKVRGKFNFKYLEQSDIDLYNDLQNRIEERLAELKDSSDLTEDEREILNSINYSLDAIRTRKLRSDYTTEFSKLKKNVENSYFILRDLEKKRDETGSIDRTLLDQIADARNQYARHEEIFASFFNRNNGVQYIMGTIAKRGSIKEEPNPYLYESVPTSSEDMVLVPNKKYRIRRLKEQAYNPDYQESFIKRKNGKGMLPMPKGIRFNTTTNQFEIQPGAKYVNPKFLELQKNQKALDFYTKWIVENFLLKQKLATGQPLGFTVPFVKQLGLENVINKGIAGLGREYKEKAQDMMYSGSKFEKATNESGMAGADRILFKENQRMPAELTTTNGIEAIMNWNSGYYLNRKMATVGLEMSAVLDYLNNLKEHLTVSGKTNSQHAEMVVKLNTIINQIEYNKNKFVHGQIYERENAPNKIFNRKTARIFMQAASFGRMAFDVPMQIGNLLSGNVQAFLSTSSTRHADGTDYLAAKKMIYTRWFPKLLSDYGKISDTSLESKIYRYMNPLSKDLDKMFDVNTASKFRRAANRVFNFGDMSMAIQDKGELEIGLTTMLMIMNHQKYEVFEMDPQGNVIYDNGVPVFKKDGNGNTTYVNAIDAFALDNGSLVLRKDVNVTADEIARLKGTIMTEIYRFQGNYAAYTRSKFGGSLIGSLYEFYRKYLIPAVSARFSVGGFEGVGSAYSWDTGEAYMGWYTAIGKMFKYYGLGTAGKTLLYDTLLPGFAKKSIKFESEVGDYYRSRAAMAGREIMFAIAAYMLYQALRQLVMDSDDDDLSAAELMAIRALVKTTNESKSMVPIPWIGGTRDYIDQFSQLTSVLREGKTAWDLVENAGWYADYTVTGSDFAYERGFYQNDTDRYDEGDPKVMKNFNDLLGISNVVDVFEPYEAAKRAVKNK